jgi:hypothetical protein
VGTASPSSSAGKSSFGQSHMRATLDHNLVRGCDLPVSRPLRPPRSGVSRPPQFSRPERAEPGRGVQCGARQSQHTRIMTREPRARRERLPTHAPKVKASGRFPRNRPPVRAYPAPDPEESGSDGALCRQRQNAGGCSRRHSGVALGRSARGRPLSSEEEGDDQHHDDDDHRGDADPDVQLAP